MTGYLIGTIAGLFGVVLALYWRNSSTKNGALADALGIENATLHGQLMLERFERAKLQELYIETDKELNALQQAQLASATGPALRAIAKRVLSPEDDSPTAIHVPDQASTSRGTS